MYYCPKRGRYITDKEHADELISYGVKADKCRVCVYRAWCSRKEKDNIGCEDNFIFREDGVYSIIFEKQNKDDMKRLRKISKENRDRIIKNGE